MSIQYTVLGFKPTTFGHESPPTTTIPGLHSYNRVMIVIYDSRVTLDKKISIKSCKLYSRHFYQISHKIVST